MHNIPRRRLLFPLSISRVGLTGAVCRLYYCNGPRHNLNTVCPPLPYEEEAEANKILQHAMSCLLDHFGYQDYLFSLLSFTVTTATLGYNSSFSWHSTNNYDQNISIKFQAIIILLSNHASAEQVSSWLPYLIDGKLLILAYCVSAGSSHHGLGNVTKEGLRCFFFFFSSFSST